MSCGGEYIDNLLRKTIPPSRSAGRAAIAGPAFIYVDHDTGQLSTILGYPTHQLK
jgi:hypothetical protein